MATTIRAFLRGLVSWKSACMARPYRFRRDLAPVYRLLNLLGITTRSMDMSLFRRGDIGQAGRRPVRLDYRVFVATLQALQLATATARAESLCDGGEAGAPAQHRDPLAEILLGSECWQEAVV